jgi:hypothetical protein
MSLDKIQQLVSSLAKTVENNERLATPVLAVKLTKCMAAYPHDQTIGMVSRVISDMASNKTLFIRKGEFKALYQKLYSRGSKFAELFQDELGEKVASSLYSVKYPHNGWAACKKHADEHEKNGAKVEPIAESEVHAKCHDCTEQRKESSTANPYHVGDQVLANALESAFDKHIPLKMYSQPLANKALKSVGDTLDAWNLRPTVLTVSAGSDKFLVIKADYETPKGITSFYVPVEVHNANVIEASVFMGNAGPQELNHSNIKSYLTALAGSKLQVDAASILGVLTKAASENREVSDAELALTRLTAKRQGKSEFFQGQVVGQKVSEASQKDVQLPKFEQVNDFESKFNTVQGLATWEFGADKVNAARNHIVRELASFGHRNPQVVVLGHKDQTLLFGVSVDTGKVAFTVPVKVVNGKLTKSTVLMCNGSIASFSQAGLNQLVADKRVDTKVAAAASTMSALKPSQVIDDLRAALAEDNYDKAEDALNVLAHSGDTKAYATAFQVYMNGLAGNKVAATQCSKMIKSAVSEHPVCSHTGLPINKVYQDKDGHCRPLFRKGMDETYEGAVFNNSKIFG